MLNVCWSFAQEFFIPLMRIEKSLVGIIKSVYRDAQKSSYFAISKLFFGDTSNFQSIVLHFGSSDEL